MTTSQKDAKVLFNHMHFDLMHIYNNMLKNQVELYADDRSETQYVHRVVTHNVRGQSYVMEFVIRYYKKSTTVKITRYDDGNIVLTDFEAFNGPNAGIHFTMISVGLRNRNLVAPCDFETFN